jgi:hypothetical protein
MAELDVRALTAEPPNTKYGSEPSEEQRRRRPPEGHGVNEMRRQRRRHIPPKPRNEVRLRPSALAPPRECFFRSQKRDQPLRCTEQTSPKSTERPPFLLQRSAHWALRGIGFRPSKPIRRRNGVSSGARSRRLFADRRPQTGSNRGDDVTTFAPDPSPGATDRELNN